MTTPTTARELERRARRGRTLGAALAEIAASVAVDRSIVWPSIDYQADPVRFFREVLGVEPWSRQVEVIEAVRDHKRVAVSSGHKVSKSHTAGGIALWFYCCFPDARVVMSSTTSRQVDQILWREVRMMLARAKARIDGDLHELARSGLKAADFREIVGFTAREAEAVAGISGRNLLYIIDEASGVPQEIFDAIEGNRAGGARLVMFSNPTRTEGEHYEAFASKAAFYKAIRISSEETPNVVEGREVIPGLATREWIEEKRAEWGAESPLYKIRVQGLHVVGEDGKILTVHDLDQAEARWADASDEGRLQLGLDPAGPGTAGDETAIAVRRGNKILAILTWRGLPEAGIVANLLGTIATYRRPKEHPPIVCVDREGPIGSSLYGLLKAHAETSPDAFEVYGVRSSDRALRIPEVYDRVRDELWANLAQWIREGGAIPEDARLSKELHAPEWIGQITGRLKATPKDELRKKLDGRSPDRADACALSVWVPMAVIQEQRAAAGGAEDAEGGDDLDPYTATPISPYAGQGWNGDE